MTSDDRFNSERTNEGNIVMRFATSGRVHATDDGAVYNVINCSSKNGLRSESSDAARKRKRNAGRRWRETSRPEAMLHTDFSAKWNYYYTCTPARVPTTRYIMLLLCFFLISSFPRRRNRYYCSTRCDLFRSRNTATAARGVFSAVLRHSIEALEQWSPNGRPRTKK